MRKDAEASHGISYRARIVGTREDVWNNAGNDTACRKMLKHVDKFALDGAECSRVNEFSGVQTYFHNLHSSLEETSDPREKKIRCRGCRGTAEIHREIVEQNDVWMMER